MQSPARVDFSSRLTIHPRQDPRDIRRTHSYSGRAASALRGVVALPEDEKVHYSARSPRQRYRIAGSVRSRSGRRSHLQLGGKFCSRLSLPQTQSLTKLLPVQVAPLFTENFDYQFFYPDFVNGLLTSDLLGKTICCTILESTPASLQGSARAPAWAFSVSNTKSYDAMSKAILARKAYPMAPDENMPNRSARYEQRRARVYYGKDVDLSRCAPESTQQRTSAFNLTYEFCDLCRTCKISSTSLIGTSSRIGPNTYISHSVLGDSVQTGSSCQIVNSYVFAGAVLGDGCVVRDSVVGESVRIAPGAVVEQGCLIAAGAVIGEEAKLRGCRVSLEEYDGDEFDVRGCTREFELQHHESNRSTLTICSKLSRRRCAGPPLAFGGSE
jgi:hypothetical protein